MMDWLAAISQQDKSLEGLLARRNMEKQLSVLQDVARLSEGKRQHGVDTAMREKEIAEQSEYRRSQQEATQAQREQMAREREIDNKRARFTATRSAIKPGDRIQDPEVVGLINEFEGGDQLTQDEKDPTAHIYRKHEFEQQQLKLKQQEEIRAAEEKRQQRELQLREKADQRAEKEQGNRDQREARAAQTAQQKQKAAEAAMRDVPVSLRPAIKARAEEIIATNSNVWDMLPWADSESNKADAWLTAAAEVKKKAQEQGLMPPGPVATPPPPGGGRGAAPGGGAPAPQAPARKRYDMNGQLISGG